MLVRLWRAAFSSGRDDRARVFEDGQQDQRDQHQPDGRKDDQLRRFLGFAMTVMY